MSRQIIRPQLNETVQVQIACQEPQKVVNDRDGKPETQWLYALNANEAMMYASNIIHQAIEKSGAQQGDTIAISRQYGKCSVEVLSDAQEPPRRNIRPDSALPAKPPARQNGNAYQEPAARPAPPAVQEAATRAANMPAVIRESHPLADNFIPFLRAAAIACMEIQRESTAQGFKIEFNTRDISAIASTLFIQAAKGGR